VNCGDPGTPANAQREGDRFLYGDQVMFTCDDGYYQSSGPEGGVRTCMETGLWSGTQPTCACEWVCRLQTTIHYIVYHSIHFSTLQYTTVYYNVLNIPAVAKQPSHVSWLALLCLLGVVLVVVMTTVLCHKFRKRKRQL